jgi:hypothetical protein
MSGFEIQFIIDCGKYAAGAFAIAVLCVLAASMQYQHHNKGE